MRFITHSWQNYNGGPIFTKNTSKMKKRPKLATFKTSSELNFIPRG